MRLNPRVLLRDWLNKPTPAERAEFDRRYEAIAALRPEEGGWWETATGWKPKDGHAPSCAMTGDPATCNCWSARSSTEGSP